MSEAFKFLETNAFFINNEDLDSDVVSINDAYWACKMFAAEELEKILEQIDAVCFEGRASVYVLIDQKIKQLKSKRSKINES